jgi:hypothetical protein
MFDTQVLTIVFFTDLFLTEAAGFLMGIQIGNGMCFYSIIRNGKVTRRVERMFSLQVIRPIVFTHDGPADRTFNVLIVVWHF